MNKLITAALRTKLIFPLFSFFMIGCGGGGSTGTVTPPTPTVTVVPTSLRTMQDELDHVKTIANALVQSSLGYWEADFGNGVIMIYVPKGTFTMGNNQLSSTVVTQSYVATPEHKVNLDHYWISKTPITKEQFRLFASTNNYMTDVEMSGHAGCWVYDFSGRGFVEKKRYHWDNAFKDVIAMFPEITINDQHPVNCVSWNDSIAYASWLANTNGLNFTLPTEAEWEFAARGNDGRIYPWGNQEPDGTRANYADDVFNNYFPNTEQSLVHFGANDGFAITSPVGSFPNGQSPIGALDMAGNLTEWVYDAEYTYTSSEINNPINLPQNSGNASNIRMQKAGFWAGSAGRIGVTPDEVDFGHNIRSDSRQGDTQNSADDHLGFRVAISYTNRN